MQKKKKIVLKFFKMKKCSWAGAYLDVLGCALGDLPLVTEPLGELLGQEAAHNGLKWAKIIDSKASRFLTWIFTAAFSMRLRSSRRRWNLQRARNRRIMLYKATISTRFY